MEIVRSSHRRCSVKKSVLKNFAKFTGKHVRQSLRPATLLKKRLWHRCFHVNFAKFLRTPFLQNTSRRLLLKEALLGSILDMEDLDETVKNTMESKEAVTIIKRYEEILKNQNKRIINIEKTDWEHMGKQGKLLERFKEEDGFLDMMGLSQSHAYFKIRLYNFLLK